MTKTHTELVTACAFENLLETVHLTAIRNRSKARFAKHWREDIEQAEFLHRQILKDIVTNEVPESIAPTFK